MRNFFVFLLTVLCAVGCTEFEEPLHVQEAENEVVTVQTRAGATPVFEELENPYFLSRMRRITGNNTLQPTHKYVRFLPADSAQLNLLEDQLALDLFDYPLDVNIEDYEEYIDPTIPEGEFTWQYTAVPANFSFPAGIQKEILEDCYIPDDDDMMPSGTRWGYISVEEAAILDA